MYISVELGIIAKAKQRQGLVEYSLINAHAAWNLSLRGTQERLDKSSCCIIYTLFMKIIRYNHFSYMYISVELGIIANAKQRSLLVKYCF